MTPEEIKIEMMKVKVPWFVGFAEKFWFKAGRFIVFFGMLAFLPLFIIYNNVSMVAALSMWGWMLGLGGFLVLCGLLMLFSHLIEGGFVKKQAAKFGITVYQWNAYAKELDLRSY